MHDWKTKLAYAATVALVLASSLAGAAEGWTW